MPEKHAQWPAVDVCIWCRFTTLISRRRVDSGAARKDQGHVRDVGVDIRPAAGCYSRLSAVQLSTDRTRAVTEINGISSSVAF